MSTPKKAKTTDDGSGVVDPAHALHLSQLSTLRQYVESCPHVPRNCAAVRAALAGLDGELKRAERDERLRQKFAREKRVSEEEAERARREAEEEDDEEGMGDEGRFVGKDSKGVRPMDDDDDVDDGEWQSVPSPASPPPPAASTSSSLRTSPEIVDPAALAAAAASTASPSSSLLFPPSATSAEESPFGRDLASASIAAMARSGTRITAPLAAVALALHGAVTSDLVGFRCTGVPDDDDDDDDDESGQQGGKTSKKKKKKGGFAPPIRELPKTKFVPDLWDARAGGGGSPPPPGGGVGGTGRPRVSLRYRKDGLGTTILRVVLLPPSDDDGPTSDGGGDTTEMMVEGGNDDVGGVSGSGGGGGGERVRVRLTSTSTGGSSGAAEPGGPGGRELIFPLGRHVNLDGLRKGMETAGGRGGIEPALHYKALAGLMTDFCRVFDLGGVDDTNGGNGAVGGVAAAAAAVGTGTGTAPVAGGRTAPLSVVPPIAPDGGGGNGNRNGNGGGDLRPAPGRSPLIDDFGAGSQNRPGGDFAGDLAPGGIVDPRLTGGRPGLGGGTGGSLMGPNHPAFRDGTYGIGDDYDDLVGGGGGGVGDDPRMPRIGGTGMQPRFDPFYPPGVGPDPGRGIGGGRGGRGMGGRGRGRGRGGRGRAPPSGGDPNPDHQRPPSDHMFM